MYQKVFVDDAWARSGNIYLAIGHVNLTLGKRKTDEGGVGYRVGRKAAENEGMTIDFLPPEDMRRVYSRPIGEDIVIAMYMNNRAVEALARGKPDDAYWYAREAVMQSPGFMVAYNTLGAVYHKHGDLREAEAVLRFVLAREPANTRVMANLVAVLRRVRAARRVGAARGEAREARAGAPVRVLQARHGGDARRRPARGQGDRSSASSRARPIGTSSTSGSRSRSWVWARARRRASTSRSP